MTTAIQEYSKTEAALADLTRRYDKKEYAVASKEGLADAKDARKEIRDYRTGLEVMRKALKAPALERSRLIDAEAKRITAVLVSIEEPIATQIKAEADRVEAVQQKRIDDETKRVSDIQERIADLGQPVLTDLHAMGLPTSEKVKMFIQDIGGIRINDSFEEFQGIAHRTKDETLAHLERELVAACAREEADRKHEAEKIKMIELREADEKRHEKSRVALAESNQREQEALDKQRAEQAAAQEKIDATQKELADAAAEKEKLKAKAEADLADVESQKQRDIFPGIEQIVTCLAEGFVVSEETATGWLEFMSAHER